MGDGRKYWDELAEHEAYQEKLARIKAMSDSEVLAAFEQLSDNLQRMDDGTLVMRRNQWRLLDGSLNTLTKVLHK